MIPKDLARKIRAIQIHTRKTVNDVMAGEYGSVFRGRGMEFDEVREYAPGDDIRSIDWNVTARTGHPYVKRYVEERELTVLFAVDLSASGDFGTVERTKNETAAELCALLAFSAIRNNDKVGLVVFTEGIELFVPPAKGTSHVLRLIRDLLAFQPKGKGTDIAAALEYVGRVQRRRAVVFLVSDFRDEGFEKPLRIVARRHDLVALSLADPRERELPAVGLAELEDPETGERLLIDTHGGAVRQRYAALARSREEALRQLFRRNDIDHVEVMDGRDYVKDLIAFFRRREQRR